MIAALVVFAVLVIARNEGVWSYLSRRPAAFDGHSALALMTHGLWPLSIAAALCLIGFGLGRRALRALQLRPEGGLESVIGAALGIGLLGQAVFLLGWSGELKPVFLLGLLAAAAFLAATAWTRPRLPQRKPIGFVPDILVGLLAFGVFHLLIVSLAPPTEWDVRAYHLALPEIYLRAGRLVDIPWMIHSHWPHLMETLYALPLAMGQDGAAALLHVATVLMLAAGVFLAARRDGHAAPWAAVLILAGQPALLRGAPTAHADGACALFFFAAAAALAKWEEKRQDGWLAAAGLLAGLSASAKLFGAAGAATWTIYIAWRTRKIRETALFAACAGAIVGPWLLRTALATGDPFWPLLGLTRAAAELSARYQNSNLWNWPPPSWMLTNHGPAFLLIPLLVLAALGRGALPASRVERALWMTAPLLLLLAVRHHEAWRFLIPLYGAAAMACGRFCERAFSQSRIQRLAAATLTALAAVPLLLLTQNNELFAVLGLRSQASPAADPRVLYEERSIDVAAFLRETRAVLPPGARVLLFREIRGYGAGFDYMWGDPMNQTEIDYRRLDDAAALAARLKELGVTFVLDHPGSHLYQEDPIYYDRRTLDLMAECLKRHARPRLQREGLALYELL